MATPASGGTETKDLGKLLVALKGATEDIKSDMEAQQKEIRETGTTSKELAKKFADHEKAYDQLTADLSGYKEMSERFQAFEAKFHEFEAKSSRPGATDGKQKSLGAIFTESAAYKDVISSKRFESAPVMVEDLFGQYAIKALSLATGSAGDIPVHLRFPDIITPGVPKLRIRDMLTVAKTSTSAIDYIQETGFTTEASPNTQKQGAAAPTAEGSALPEARLMFTIKTANVRTVGHWIAVTKQAITDAQQLRAYVDGRLTYGLYYAEERQLLYGNGTDPNIQGLLTHPNIQTYLWSAGPAGLGGNRDTKVDAVRRSFTKSQLAQYPVTGVVMHYSDWEDIELAKASDGHYLWVSSFNPLYKTETIWRVPVTVTDAINQGTWLSGAFQLGAYLWDREEASIQISEQHASFFTQNMVAIKADERIALTIFRPESFCKGTFDAPPSAT